MHPNLCFNSYYLDMGTEPEIPSPGETASDKQRMKISTAVFKYFRISKFKLKNVEKSAFVS